MCKSRRMRDVRRVSFPPARGRVMPVIKINGQQFALQPGANRLGGGTTADVIIGGDDVGIQAILDLGADNRATIRKSNDQNVIRVNGMALGGPTPLIHGDKVEIAGKEMFFADDAKVGATQFVSASDVAAIASKRTGPARATAATGGRLVSLVDGKEYAVPEAGVTIGRDASADIVVAQTAVSRRHAQVIASANGYVVNDLSTNGIFVNGVKVNASQSLSRADVIRVGTEEFRFYADVAPIAKPAGAPAAAVPPAPPTPAPAPTGAPTPPQRPATPPPVAAPTEPRPVTPPPAAAAPTVPRPATPPPAAPPPPQAAAPKPAAPASPVAKAPPPPPPTPQRAKEAAADAAREPVTIKKGVPRWAILLIVVAVLAVVAYFVTQR